jgi:hypothetical protein
MPPSEMRMDDVTKAASLAVLGVLLTACGNPCGDAEDRSVTLDELPCNMTRTDGVWESHPWPPIDDEQCHWLEFRGCSEYQIEHPLGRIPTLVVGYTSFDQDGGFATVGSGNSFVIEEASASTVTIRNDQNQLFYLKLVLE